MRRNYIIGAALLLVAAPASAVTLQPDMSTDLFGTTVAARPELAGTILVDRFTSYTFQGLSGTVSGQVQERVSRSTLDSTIIFSWRVIANAGSADLINAFRVGGFPSGPLDGDYRLDGAGTVGPDTAYVFGPPFAGNINFVFGSGLAGGQSSYFMFLKSTATNYAETGVFDVASNNYARDSQLFRTFAPAPAATTVPEPATWAMLVLGFGLVGAVNRRRSAKVTA